nr:hypothetical protein [Tanacetum cinerariifolium]
MASNCSDQNARYAISLQRGTMAEYENIVLSWPSEEAPPVIKGSLDANEVISTIDDIFDIGESNVESIEVRSEFSKFLENKESVKEVVVGGGEVDGRLDEINLNVSDELADNGKAKEEKGVGCGSGRHENYGSGRRDSGRSKIWDPGIKIHFRHHLEDKVAVKEWGMIRPGSKPPLKVLEPRKVGLARIPIDTNPSRTSREFKVSKLARKDSCGQHHVIDQVNHNRGCSQVEQKIKFNHGRQPKPPHERCLGIRKHPLELYATAAWLPVDLEVVTF